MAPSSLPAFHSAGLKRLCANLEAVATAVARPVVYKLAQQSRPGAAAQVMSFASPARHRHWVTDARPYRLPKRIINAPAVSEPHQD